MFDFPVVKCSKRNEYRTMVGRATRLNVTRRALYRVIKPYELTFVLNIHLESRMFWCEADGTKVQVL